MLNKNIFIENIDKITKENLVYAYFNIVHNIDDPKYFIGYVLDGNIFTSMDWMFIGNTIISNTKEDYFGCWDSLDGDSPTQRTCSKCKKTVYMAQDIKYILKLHKEGKAFCTSSYEIKSEYFNVSPHAKAILSKVEENLLIEIEHRVSILEFVSGLRMYAKLPDNVDTISLEEYFIYAMNQKINVYKKRSKDNFLHDIVREVYPSFYINIYNVLEYALNGVNNEALSTKVYEQMKKEIEQVDNIKSLKLN